MSERVVDEGQSWASDIIGVVSGVGLYPVLFFLEPSCAYTFRLEAGDRLRLGGVSSTSTARVHHAARRHGGGVAARRASGSLAGCGDDDAPHQRDVHPSDGLIP